MISIAIQSKKYSQKEILSHINLNFETGKVYGIVGENGAGKTTLFKCIAGLEKFEGSISSNFEPLKNHLGYLATETYFFDKITGEEYIRLLGNARDKELIDLQSKNIFDLPLNQYVATYSTGMKKKLAFTAILLQENQYFILDEPFNGVDIQSNILITEILLQLKKLNKIVLISSHIFSTLKETCDEIFLLKNGKIELHAYQKDFDALENELKQTTIGNLIDKLDLK